MNNPSANFKPFFSIGDWDSKLPFATILELTEEFKNHKKKFKSFKISKESIIHTADIPRELCRLIGVLMDQIEKKIIEDKEWSISDVELKNRLCKWFLKTYTQPRSIDDNLITSLQSQITAFKSFIDNQRHMPMYIGSDFYLGRHNQNYEQYEIILGDTHYELKWSSWFFKGYWFFESLCYYIINKHFLKNPKFDSVTHIGAINTRYSIAYRIKVEDISKDLYDFTLAKVEESRFR